MRAPNKKEVLKITRVLLLQHIHHQIYLATRSPSFITNILSIDDARL